MAFLHWVAEGNRPFESPTLRHSRLRRNSLSAIGSSKNGAEFRHFARGNGTSVRQRAALFGRIFLFLSAFSLLQRNLVRPGYVVRLLRNQALVPNIAKKSLMLLRLGARGIEVRAIRGRTGRPAVILTCSDQPG